MERKSLRNPFDSDVVTSPEQSPPADVPEIHSETFKLCRQAYEDVVRYHSSLSVLLYGEAGCGKTHLLSRFRRWLSGGIDAPPSRSPAVLVAIRMETAPSQIWRHIRRRFAQELTQRGADGRCTLDGILRRFAASHSGNLAKALEAAQLMFLDLDMEKVLEYFAAGQHRRLCRAWLQGDGLSDEELRLLNLSSTRLEEVEDEFAEASARHMVLAIIQVCAPSPVVFCFDQVEALGISQRGNNNFKPFGRMGAALVDGSENVLVISTVLQAFLRDLENGCNASDYQRISKRKSDLEPLDLKLGRALIDSRVALVPEIKGENPIPESRLAAVFDNPTRRCVARKLIHEARRLFEDWQQFTPPPPPSIPEFLNKELERLWASAESRSKPETADAVLAHGLPVALEMLGRKTTSTGDGLKIDGGASPIGVHFINQPNLRSVAATLKRLLDRGTPAGPLRLVRDQRLPIPPSAKATRERIAQIEKGGGLLVHVEAEALAALDAMRKLLTAATSGDLSSNGEAVEEKTVREWLARNLPQPVKRFAAELLGEGEVDPNPDALLELVGSRKVVSVAEAVQAISWPRDRIEDYARTHPMNIRWFGGPCAVVCLAVTSDATREINHAE